MPKIYCHRKDCVYRKHHLCDHAGMVTFSPSLGCMTYKNIRQVTCVRNCQRKGDCQFIWDADRIVNLVGDARDRSDICEGYSYG